MNWSGVRVLVTGAGGFIGSHLVEELANRGAHIRAFVRYNSRGDRGMLRFLPESLCPQVEVVAGNLCDEGAVLSAMEKCEYVFHLGALIAIQYSYLHPREVIDTNVIGTVNVLEAARRTCPRRVIHTSTSEVYGTAQTASIAENHPLCGQSPYSASKIGADKIVESYHRAFDLPVVTVRPFNTYGPRQSARAVIPTIITQVLTLDVVRLGSLDPTRDFTYVSDTVRGFLCAAETERALGLEINLGNGDEISVGNLAGKIVELVGRRVSVDVRPERLRPWNSEVHRLRADASLAENVLNWKPIVSLDDGLRQTISWVRGNLNAYRVGEYEV